MIIYSELTKQKYSTMEAAEAAEKKYIENKQKERRTEQDKKIKSDEVLKAYDSLKIAKMHFEKELSDYCQKYGLWLYTDIANEDISFL